MNAAAAGTGRDLLMSLKATAGAPGAKAVLCVGYPPKALLRPVATAPAWFNAEDIRLLGEWRNRHVTSFLTEFEATPDRTRRWLAETVGPADNKILFMLDLPDGSTIGHLGIGFIDWTNRYGEADAIVRGGDAPKGLMTEALLQTLGWARHSLGLMRIGVRVRSDNPALSFYEKVGFVETERVALRKSREANMIRWSESPGAKEDGISLVHMILRDGALAS